MNIQKYEALVKCPKLNLIFKDSLDLSELNPLGEFPTDRSIVLNADIGGPYLEPVLLELASLRDVLGWQIYLRDDLKDSSVAQQLDFKNFFNDQLLNGHRAHLIIFESGDGFKNKPLMVFDNASIGRKNNYLQVIQNLKTIINHDQVLKPHDPRLKPIEKSMLRKFC